MGYVTLESVIPYDLGYALLRDCWGRGYATEAAGAVLDWARCDGMTYVTATHDVHNPASGRVMRRLGGVPRPAYDGYRKRYPNHFVEQDMD